MRFAQRIVVLVRPLHILISDEIIVGRLNLLGGEQPRHGHVPAIVIPANLFERQRLGHGHHSFNASMRDARSKSFSVSPPASCVVSWSVTRGYVNVTSG